MERFGHAHGRENAGAEGECSDCCDRHLHPDAIQIVVVGDPEPLGELAEVAEVDNLG